jgi:alpha-L-fucosidase/DNA-binding FadR family transcriptional regulator
MPNDRAASSRGRLILVTDSAAMGEPADGSPADAGVEASALRSAASHALDQVLALIAHGALNPGSQLPAERDLSLQLGVSRSSIREATSALVALGLLEARRGAGVFVTSLDPAHLLSSLTLTLAVAPEQTRTESSELATTLEPVAAGLAAARADARTLSVLDELARVAAEATEPGEWLRAEALFHRALAAASGNATLAALLEATWRAGAPADRLPDLLQRAAGDHRRLMAALHSHEPERARVAAAAHSYLDVLALADAELAAPAEAPSIAAAARPVPTWWRDAKLGVIVHWGLYSVPGWAPLDDSLVELLTDEEADDAISRPDEELDPIVRHCFSEWYQNGASVPGSPTWRHHREVYGDAAYADFRSPFDLAVRQLDPDSWVEQFQAAGARYAVMVAKHHDGYLLWPSAYENPRQESWASERDIVGDLGKALRRRGMKVGIYYSAGIDWTFDSLPIARLKDVRMATPIDPEYAEYVEAQWRELIDRYAPDILWNDMGYPDGGDVEELLREYYALMPDGVVTDRFGAVSYDVATPNYARRHAIADRPWESVRPLGMSFGWNRQESTTETLTGRELVHLLLDVVSKNGNLLLGVSPDDHGQIPEVQQRSLAELGDWLARNGTAVYGTRPWESAETTTAEGVPVRFTCSGDTLYVHLLAQADTSATVLGLTIADDTTAAHVADGSPVALRRVRGGVRFDGLTIDPSATVVAVTAVGAKLEAWRSPGIVR